MMVEAGDRRPAPAPITHQDLSPRRRTRGAVAGVHIAAGLCTLLSGVVLLGGYGLNHASKASAFTDTSEYVVLIGTVILTALGVAASVLGRGRFAQFALVGWPALVALVVVTFALKY